jgi:cation transport regulator ChaB
VPIEKEEDLPGALQRSADEAQRTFAKTLVSALDTDDGDEERAHRAAEPEEGAPLSRRRPVRRIPA